MHPMLTLNDILKAHQRIAHAVRRTPLVRSAALSERWGADVWLKLENLQPTGSFKVRGALYKMMMLTDPNRPLVTASAGNHALGVAYAASVLGRTDVTLFLPTTAPTTKVNRLRRFPVTLHLVGHTYEEAHQAAEDFARSHDAVYLPAYDDLTVIAGQATVSLEIVTEIPSLDLLLIPVGGGGLIAGAVVVTKAMAPQARVVGIQPTASPAALRSFQEGRALEVYDPEPTLADGLAGGFGHLPFLLTREQIDVVLASEADIHQAIYTLLAEEQLVIEASGAIAIAPLLAQPTTLPNAGRNAAGKPATIVALLTGANIDPNIIHQILSHALRAP